MAQTRTYRFYVRNSSGSPMWVYLQATDNFNAMQLARAIYGRDLLSEGPSLVV